jgi:hypothetical protein
MEAEDEGDLIYVGDEQASAEHAEDLVEQDKEEYYDDGAGVEGNEAVDVEPEGDVGDDAYEIRDEEDNIEEITDDTEKDAAGAYEKSTDEKGGGKDDNMLVVDEWDNGDVESISDEGETRSRTYVFSHYA